MKRIFLLTLVLLTLSFPAHSQEVVQWSASYNADLSQIEIKAAIKEGWHLYSQHIDNNVGPVPTQFSFQSSDNFQLKGAVIEPKAIQKYDANFEATLNFFEQEVVFIQKIDVFRKTTLEGEVTFMVCDETMCLPPVDQPIKIELLPKNQ
jgi:hypothetical protein